MRPEFPTSTETDAFSLPAVEFRHLRYVVAASDCGSFREAGAALGVRESAISRRIRDLEDQVGASLFNRHSGGVRLTLADQKFLRRARKALRQMGDGLIATVRSCGVVDAPAALKPITCIVILEQSAPQPPE